MIDPEVVQKMLDAQDIAREDAHYQLLLDEHEIMKKKFDGAMNTMTKAQQDAVMDYLGIAFAMHLRLLELACSL